LYSAIWAYPWDFIDEGYDSALGRIADSGVDAVSVAVAYHSIRSLCPHNPRRAVYHGEGGVVYFKPDPTAFEGALKPVKSNLLSDGDPLSALCAAAGKRGIKVHAWTVVTHNTRLGTANPEMSIVNAFGDRYPFGLCPANPDVRSYAVGLVKSLAARSDLATIELESLGYMGIDHTGHHSKAGIDLDELHRYLLSVCFCPHCAARMTANGVNVRSACDGIVREMRGYFGGRFTESRDDPLGALSEILGAENAEGLVAARNETVLTLMEELFWLIQKPQSLSVMVSASPLTTGAMAGVTISEARQWTDRLLVQAFRSKPTEIHDVISDVAVRRGSTPVFAGLQAIVPFVRSAGDLTTSALAAREAGADGLQFYHYGLMPLANLEWVKQALAAVNG